MIIRYAEVGDADLLCQWFNDAKIIAHAGLPNGLNTSREKIIHSLGKETDKTCCLLIIEVDHILIGEMNYRNKGQGTVAIGIKICTTEKQGKGYGTVFLSMLINHLFSSGYNKIVLDTDLENIRAQHVYEKLGFQKLRNNRDS